MKTQEILLASALIAVVSGAGAALATGAFQKSPARAEPEARAATLRSDESPQAGSAEASRAIDELRLENASLQERLGALEARLAEALSARTPVVTPSVDSAPLALAAGGEVGSLASPFALTPEFVASVDQALGTIKAREDAERELKRKELQALRIEERVSKLQTELGLNNRQASELRTALITQDDKREALFTSMREGTGEPRDMRETFRVLRDETHATLQGFLTPDQFAAYQKSEESEFGRRGDFGGGRGTDGGNRPGR